MLLQYFGFKEEPFGATPDPQCLFPSHTHREALASLEYGFHSNRGFTAMIASPGMGKTTLLCRLLRDIGESARSVFLYDIDGECQPREFTGFILRDIGVTPGKSSFEMHEQLSNALAEETRAGRKFVIVIDEAQNLSDAVLERVRLLSNFETSQGKLMQIILSGQPQLADKLMQPSLVQLRQRISTICRLSPLSVEETAAYVDYRLTQTGYMGGPLFTKGALKLIAEASLGIPRTINNLCFNALSLCCAMKGKQVDVQMVEEVIADLELIPQSGKPAASASTVANAQFDGAEDEKRPALLFKRALLATAAVLVLCVGGVFGLAGVRSLESRGTADKHSMDQKAQPASVPAPVAAVIAPAKAAKPAQNTKQIKIVVQPNQKLQEISTEYLGGFDAERLRQIQALNPELTNPNHIEIGQEITLPKTAPVPMAKNAAPQANERNLP